MCEACFLKIKGCIGQDLADSNQPSALRPWHARSFMDSALQRLSVALQRTIQRDQILRPHLRRVKRGGVPADYFECGQTVRRRCRLPPLFEPEQQRQRQQLPYTRPPWRKLPVTGTRAARLRP